MKQTFNLIQLFCWSYRGWMAMNKMCAHTRSIYKNKYTKQKPTRVWRFREELCWLARIGTDWLATSFGVSWPLLSLSFSSLLSNLILCVEGCGYGGYTWRLQPAISCPNAANSVVFFNITSFSSSNNLSAISSNCDVACFQMRIRHN